MIETSCIRLNLMTTFWSFENLIFEFRIFKTNFN
jgi:hypothetical protein